MGERCLRLISSKGLLVFSAIEVKKSAKNSELGNSLIIPTALPNIVPVVAKSLSRLREIQGDATDKQTKFAEDPANRLKVAQKLGLSALIYASSIKRINVVAKEKA